MLQQIIQFHLITYLLVIIPYLQTIVTLVLLIIIILLFQNQLKLLPISCFLLIRFTAIHHLLLKFLSVIDPLDIEFLWDFNNGNFSNTENPTQIFSSGDYVVKLTSFMDSTHICFSTINKLITIVDSSAISN